MAAGILEGREVLTTRLKSQLGTLVSSVEIAGQNNLSSSHVVAETTLAGLLNRVYGWELGNANAISQNCPGIDLIDEGRRIAVQVTASRTVDKVRHTLEEVGKSGVRYDRLILLLITNLQPTAGMKDCTVPAYSGPMEIWNIPDVFRDAKELDAEKLDELTKYMAAELGPVKERVKELPHLDLPLASALPPTGFVGREPELAEISSRFAHKDQTVVLTGLGGMGKTELAVRYGQEHPGMVYFVRFDTSFARTIANMAQGIRPRLSNEELRLEEAILRKKVMTLLERSGPEDLLIIDNADSPTGALADLKDESYKALRALPLKLLLTTRSDAPRSTAVEPMPDEPLFQIFRNHGAELTDREMRELIRAVNGHTLTIDLIARTLNGKGWRKVTAEKMLTALRENNLRDQKYRKIATDYNQSTAQTQIYEHLSVVFDLSGMSDTDKRVMGCACLLPDGGMDSELFGESLDEEGQDALDMLLDRGWLEVRNGLLTIHPVIRLVCLTELTPTEADCGAFLDALWAQYDRKNYRRDQYTQMAELFTAAHDRLGSPDGRWLNRSGILWNELSEYQKLHDLYHTRLPALELVLPANSKGLASAYNYYGISLDGLGNYSSGLIYSEKALSIRRAVLPRDDPDLARSYTNVGCVYGSSGKHTKALEYQQKGLSIFENKLSPDDPDLATSYNHVGYTYGALGDHKKALEYQQKALKIRKKALPANHPDLAASYNNVGTTCDALGDHKRALEYHLKDLTISEKVLPADHPNLATTYNSVGGTYGALGDHNKALEYKLKALKINEKALPADHPDLAASYNNVGTTYSALGNHKKALEYQQKALTICEKVLPPEHPDLAISCSNVAWDYHELGDFQTAAKYMRRATDIFSRSSLPKTHPHRVSSTKWADEFEKEARMQQAIQATMQGFGSGSFPFGKK